MRQRGICKPGRRRHKSTYQVEEEIEKDTDQGEESIHPPAQVEGETEGDTDQGEEGIHPHSQVEEETDGDTDKTAFIHKLR